MSVDPTSSPITDIAVVYPAIGIARQALDASDWSRFTQAVDQVPAWDDRQLVIAGACGPPHTGFLRSVMASQPNPLAATMLGSNLMDEAWVIRGHGWGSTVTADQWRRTQDLLDQAEQQFIWACAVDPGFLPAWVNRIQNSMALSLGLGESRRRFAHVEAIDPQNYAGQRAMMTELCAKWHGDPAAMNAFALQCAEKAPEGSLNPAIIADAHFENALELTRHNDRPREDAWREHFGRPDVRAQIRWAAQKSVLSPAFTRQGPWVRVVSSFAVALAITDDWGAAKYCFGLLGPYADYAASGWLGNGATRFAELRATSMERG